MYSNLLSYLITRFLQLISLGIFLQISHILVANWLHVMIVEDLSCRKTLLCSWNCNNPSTPTKPQWHPLKGTCSHRTRFNSLQYGACELHCVLSPFVISFSTNLSQFNTIQGQFFRYDYSWTSWDSLPFSFASTCLLKIPNSDSLWTLFVWYH